MINWFDMGYGDATRGMLPRNHTIRLVNGLATPNMVDEYIRGYNTGLKERVPPKYRL